MSSRSKLLMRTYWLACSALAVLVIALFLAPLRFMRRARAHTPPPASTLAPPATDEPTLAPITVRDVGRDPLPPLTAHVATAAEPPLDINFADEEEDPEADSAGKPSPPTLSPAAAATAKKNLDWAMRGILPDINRCYGQALLRDPKLHGQLNIQMTLAPGSDPRWAVVEDAVVEENDLKSPLLEQCLLIAISKLRSDKPAARLYISYPLHLRPGDQAPKPANSDPAEPEPEHDSGEALYDEGDDDDD